MQKINLAEKFGKFTAHWSPKIVAELNGQHVKLVKFRGEFVWHQHEHEDELFQVVSGKFRMEFKEPIRSSAAEISSDIRTPPNGGVQFRVRTVELGPGEMIVVPRGVEHRPVAPAEVCLLLFEPATTVNTGSAGGEHTVAQPGWI